MPELVLAFLGDVVGACGRRAVSHAAPILRDQHGVHLLIVNAENSKHGSGISPDNARDIFKCVVHAITLGDHCFKDRTIIPTLADPAQPICRPANLSPLAPGKRIIRIPPPAGLSGAGPVYVMTVLGRLFMPMPADNPFFAIDRELAAITEPDAMVVVEAHAEATSEKQALAWYCLTRHTTPTPPHAPRVVAVLGSHTHVQTADARLLDHSLAAITDLGMCGPHQSVIGRSIDATLAAMTTQAPVPLEVASEDVRACGVIVRIDTESRRATGIQTVDIRARD